MPDKHLINHLQKQSLRQGKAMSSHISTQPDPSNITGHEVLIFHSSQYLLAVNRIYTRLSVFQGGLPSPYSTARIFRKEGILKAPRLAPVMIIYLREKTWKLTIQSRMKFVFAAVWAKTKSSMGESEDVFIFAFFLQISKWLTTEVFSIEWFMIFRKHLPALVYIIYYRISNKLNL